MVNDSSGGRRSPSGQVRKLRTLLAQSTMALVSIISLVQSDAAFAGTQGTTMPIKHLVIIFQENVAFDHYFATYPKALNPAGQPRFVPTPNTPSVNGLDGALLTDNPNAANPFRLNRSQAFLCTNRHAYTLQQQAMHGGLMDGFVQSLSPTDPGCNRDQVMGYFDGNTVTALWNYAQRFTLSDNFYASTIGPSTPGVINLVSGQTHGAVPAAVPNEVANGTLISDPDPANDDCSLTPDDEGSGGIITLTGRNVGDLMNSRGVTWGWFEGGFRPTSRTNGKAVCDSTHKNIRGQPILDYIPHHEPFQYYVSTANPHHLPPSSPAAVGRTDQANHQYDLGDFWRAAEGGNLPAVSFLKAAHYQDGHDGKSDPLDEQVFLVETMNRLQRLANWRDVAVVIAYDDPGGWYDHVMPPITSQSNDPVHDALLGPGLCGTPKPGRYLNRCGSGMRLPLLVASRYVQPNSVDHGVLEQTSILRFIEDNWQLGRIGDQSLDAAAASLSKVFDFNHPSRGLPLFLDPSTGEPIGRD